MVFDYIKDFKITLRLRTCFVKPRFVLYEYTNKKGAEYYWIEAVCKYVIAILPLILMVKWGYVRKSNIKRIGKGFLIGAVLILFCLPNILPLLFIDSTYMIVDWNAVSAIVLESLRQV